MSSLVHTLYDAILFQAAYSADEQLLNTLYYIDIGFVIVYYIICFAIVKVVSKDKLNIDGTMVIDKKNIVLMPQQMQQAVVYNQAVRYCTNCGNIIEGNFCSKCGNPRT